MEYLKAREMLLGATETRFNKIEEQISADIELRFDFASFALALVADSTIATAPTLAARLERLPMFVQILRDRPLVRAVEVGYDSGDFFLVRRFLPNAPAGQAVKAARGYRVCRAKRGARRRRRFRHSLPLFRSGPEPLGEGTIPGDVMDPRSRPWFQAAAKEGETVVTEPYALSTIASPAALAARQWLLCPRAYPGRRHVGATRPVSTRRS